MKKISSIPAPKETDMEVKEILIDNIDMSDRGFPDIKREGVFEHRFKCLSCGLEFKVYSWQEFRHTDENTFCPECGKKGGKFHKSIKTLSTKKEFDVLDKNEIFAQMEK